MRDMDAEKDVEDESRWPHHPLLYFPDEELEAAVARATFKWLGDADGWWAEMPGFQGVWATGPTREAARAELKSALQSWLSVGAAHGDPIEEIAGLRFHADAI